MTEAALRARIVALVAEFEDHGLNHGSSGNISVRAGENRILVTPAGARASNLSRERIVALDLDGAPLSGDTGVPSTEWRLHTEIYRARADAQAVVHSHADHCVALSCQHKPMPPFHYMVASFGGNEVPCAPYAPIGSDALAFGVRDALGARYKAALMASHGMVAVGKDLDQARDLTVKLETLARQYLLARQAGEPVLLSEDELAEVHRRYEYYGHSRMPR